MAVSWTDDKAVALYDTTTGRAFGPIFNSSEEAESFLEWLKEKSQFERTFSFHREELIFVEEPRVYRPNELEHVVQLFRDSDGR